MMKLKKKCISLVGILVFMILISVPAFADSKPSPTSIISLTSPVRGSFAVKWRVQSGISGYQVRYSTSSDFWNCKIISVRKGKTSLTRKNLTPGKRYYVHVRTYKKVGGKKYYSKWSKTKSITVKKNDTFSNIRKLINGKWLGVSSRYMNHYFWIEGNTMYYYENGTGYPESSWKIEGMVKIGNDYAILVDRDANNKSIGYRFHITNGKVTDLWFMSDVYDTHTYSAGSSLYR